MSPRADRYHLRLQVLADQASARSSRLWRYTLTRPDQEGEWLRLARPMLSGFAQAGVATSAGFASTVAQAPLGEVSALIVPDAVARVWEPLEATSIGLRDGLPWARAAEAATTRAAAVAVNAVMGPARQALAQQYPVRTKWRRMVNAGACTWCLSLSGAEWPTAEDADFGHDECKCNAVPVAELGDHNDKVLAAAGINPETVSYGRLQKIERLRTSERTALRRRQEAIDAARDETDPVRVERLSQREQDWETRAERAAERRRILETGSQRLAA
jgi:hypothetical protein